MATPILTDASRLRARKALRILGGAAVLLLVLIVGIAAWLCLAAHGSLPKLEGKLHVEGLSAPVTVLRDEHGVPHINASSLEDLFFAQGYVTAQDRLWQMDMTRRFASGRLSEILGHKYAEIDVRQRTLLIPVIAANAAAALQGRDRSYMEAYARGVNAYMAANANHLPIEFRVLHYEPEPWTIVDSMLVGVSMSEMLNLDQVQHMLKREKLTARLGSELAADLYTNNSFRDNPPVAGPDDIQAMGGTGGASQEDKLADSEEEAAPVVAAAPVTTAPRPRARRRARVAKPDNASSRNRRNKVRESRPASTRRNVRKAQARKPQQSRALQPRTRGRVRRRASLDIPTTAMQALQQNKPMLPMEQLLGTGALFPGSNNWVISGTHTASGKPLLSNDMHLTHQIPGVWYEVHLTSGNFDVAGVSMPGLPFVMVGHNQRIAWGFTNINPDVTDLYVETFNGRGEYMTSQGWQPAQHRNETIHVRWGHDINLDLTITRHGPIVSNIIPGEKRQLALKWVLFDPAAVQNPFFDVDSAQNWDEFRRAFSRFGSPGQNVVYADVDGHIGYQATGFVPIRPYHPQPETAAEEQAAAAYNAQQGLPPAYVPVSVPGVLDQEHSDLAGLPVNGSDDSNEWMGYVPFDRLPSSFDPPSGIIATANGRITPDGYPYLISAEWGSSFRTQRIYHVLSDDKKFTAADMLALQTDIFSDFDRFCAQRFVYAIDNTPQASKRVKDVAEILRAWDGQMKTDSAAATIVSAAQDSLAAMLLRPRLGDDADNYRWHMSEVWLENILLLQPPQWLPSQYPNYEALLTDAVEKAISSKGGSPASWRWGKQYPLSFSHPLFGSFPLLRSWTGPGEHEQSGNGNTVKQVGRAFGPSERMTVDLANLDASTLNIVMGESGNFLSPYYKDQWSAWYQGFTFPLVTSADAVRRSAKHQLTLEP